MKNNSKYINISFHKKVQKFRRGNHRVLILEATGFCFEGLGLTSVWKPLVLSRDSTFLAYSSPSCFSFKTFGPIVPPGGMARFVRPQLMAMPETTRVDNNNVWSRPSFDLNAGPNVLEGDFRVMGAILRQSATRVSVEDQMKGAMPGIPMKRKELENGHDSRELFQVDIK
jgi:hypothetical protein